MGLNQTVANSIHCFDGVHLCNILAHNPHAVQRGLILQQIIATSRRLYQVEGREHTLVREHAVKLYFGVPGEDVWDIAKRYSTSVDAIIEENDLAGERLEKGGMLLIPIVS